MKTCVIIDCIYKGEPQPFENFHSNGQGGIRGECKHCRTRLKALYYKDNRSKMLEQAKKYIDKNKEKHKKYQKEYHAKYYIENKDRFYTNSRSRILSGKTAAYRKKRYAEDVNFRLASLARSRRGKALKSQQTGNSMKYMESLGCAIDFFISYLEAKFLPGMNWGNYGRGEGKWQIDEIKPCASFNLSDAEQYKQCFHYTNAQPLWEKDNIKKGSVYDGVRYKNKKAA